MVPCKVFCCWAGLFLSLLLYEALKVWAEDTLTQLVLWSSACKEAFRLWCNFPTMLFALEWLAVISMFFYAEKSSKVYGIVQITPLTSVPCFYFWKHQILLLSQQWMSQLSCMVSCLALASRESVQYMSTGMTETSHVGSGPIMSDINVFESFIWLWKCVYKGVSMVTNLWFLALQTHLHLYSHLCFSFVAQTKSVSR